MPTIYGDDWCASCAGYAMAVCSEGAWGDLVLLWIAWGLRERLAVARN